MNRRTGNRIGQDRLRVEDTAGHGRREPTGKVVAGRVLTAEPDHAESAFQARPGLPVKLTAGAARCAGADAVALLELKDRLETVAEVFRTLESDARPRQHAIDHAGEGRITRLAIADADVGNAVEGHVRLRHGRRGSQAGQGECAKMLSHELLLSIAQTGTREPSRATPSQSRRADQALAPMDRSDAFGRIHVTARRQRASSPLNRPISHGATAGTRAGSRQRRRSADRNTRTLRPRKAGQRLAHAYPVSRDDTFEAAKSWRQEQ